jgi:hypothetical protein
MHGAPLRFTFAAMLLCLIASSCATPDAGLVPKPGVTANRWIGQVQHVGPDGDSLIGDVQYSYMTGSAEMILQKGQGTTLLLLRLGDNGNAYAEGPLAGMGYSGSVAGAPRRLAGWYQAMATVRRKVSGRKSRDSVLVVYPGAEGGTAAERWSFVLAPLLR